MRRLIGLAAALAALAFILALRTHAARADPEAFEFCREEGRYIQAADLPQVVEPGACPASGRVVLDNGVGSVLPAPGRGVHVESIGPSGVQELGITRRRDGTIELERVGDESEGPRSARAGGDGECSDAAFNDDDVRLDSTLYWRFNRLSTPGELTRDTAETAIRVAGVTLAGARNSCGLEDHVSAGLRYRGNTRSGADLSADGTCNSNDGRSEVAFGNLPASGLAIECKWFAVDPYGYDHLRVSDVKINKADFRWTTRPGDRSCRRSYDLRSVMTHERGHTFGLGHVDEGDHGALTMSTRINGPCQKAERSLGRGDVLGLNHKYR